MSSSQNLSDIKIKEEILEITINNDGTVYTVTQNEGENNKNLKNEDDTPNSLISNDTKNTNPDTLIPNARKRKRSRKRPRRNKALRLTTEKQETVVETVICSSSSEYSDDYGIIVSNLPNSWSYMQIKKYMDKECGPIDEMEMLQNDNSNSSGSIRISFANEEDCKKALEKLSGKEIDGTKILAEIDGVHNNSVAGSLLLVRFRNFLNSLRKPKIPVIKDKSESEMVANMTDASDKKKPWRPDLDIWEVDPKGLYGLKPQYLKSLDIETPLDRWVHVSNFRCDKSELRDIMELAGHVLLCSVFTVANRYAKVMYSHPLEAVQAVSMLNCQMFYGKTLSVTIDKCPADTVMLPKGLANIGLGLGKAGKPLRNIVRHYERFLNNQSSLVNPVIFDVDATNVNNEFSTDSLIREANSDGKEPHTEFEDILEFKIMNVSELKTFVDENNGGESNQNNEEQPTNLQSDSQNGSTTSKSNLNKSAQNVILTIATKNVQNNSIHPQVSPVGHSPGGPSNVGPITRPQYPIHKQPGPGPFGSIASGARPPGIEPFSRGLVTPVQPNLRGLRPIGLRPQVLMPVNSSGPVGLRPVRVGLAPLTRPTGSQIVPVTESATVQLSNLPPSTTFPLLCEKLSHCGQVLSLQLTSPGCAVVTFSRPIHAEICFKKYNGINADGRAINVQLM